MDAHKHTITYIAPLRTARILGVVGLILGLLLVPVVHMLWTQYTSRIWGVPLSASTYISIPLTAGALSFALSFCACVTYNTLVKRLGGIEFVTSGHP
jgi:hypothetical protein